MTSALLILGSVFLMLAALIHVLIFTLESVLWARPSTWKAFGMNSQQDADAAKPLAFNQGFYNAFLAVGVFVGLALTTSAVQQAGYGLAIFAASSMVAAALVLVLSSPKLARAAAIQGVAPLLGVILTVAGLAAA